MGRQKERLSQSYYVAKELGSYGGVRPLSKKSKQAPEWVKEWLETQDAYTFHKPVRHKFPWWKVIVSGLHRQWQADLIHVSNLSGYNCGFKFLLTCIDVFSKKAWVVPLKNKTGKTLVCAFESILATLPRSLETDKGTEFTNREFQQWLKDHDVHFFTTENGDIQASIVEQFNPTLQSKMWRYFTRQNTLVYVDVLESMVDVYSRTPHHSVGMAPSDVTSRNKAKGWFRIYADPAPY